LAGYLLRQSLPSTILQNKPCLQTVLRFPFYSRSAKGHRLVRAGTILTIARTVIWASWSALDSKSERLRLLHHFTTTSKDCEIQMGHVDAVCWIGNSQSYLYCRRVCRGCTGVVCGVEILRRGPGREGTLRCGVDVATNDVPVRCCDLLRPPLGPDRRLDFVAITFSFKG